MGPKIKVLGGLIVLALCMMQLYILPLGSSFNNVGETQASIVPVMSASPRQPLGSASPDSQAAIAAGEMHSLGLRSDGTLWAWGYNLHGELGLGDTTHRYSPTQVGTSSNWTAIAARSYHSFALKSDGTLWAWGSNGYGQLGLGDNGLGTERHSPTQVGTSTNWTTIAAGGKRSLGLKSDGTLWAWGSGYEDSPTQVGTATNWSAIAVGDEGSHSLALQSDGTLWAWGPNYNGGLGLGDITWRDSPTQVGTSSNWTAIAAGDYHSLGLRSDGTLWVWGYNNHGQLGLGDTTDRYSPTQVGTSANWSAIATGRAHSLGLRSDGTVYAWGKNDFGELGDGTTTDRHTPVQVSGLNDVTAIAGGLNHSLALYSDGTMWAWGSNFYGELGDGTTTDRHTPVQVSTSTGMSTIVVAIIAVVGCIGGVIAFVKWKQRAPKKTRGGAATEKRVSAPPKKKPLIKKAPPKRAPARVEKVPPRAAPEEDPLKILKLRLAKGEITREEYEEMKKALET